ncbi:MAG: SCP2 sterol-binding domain-containing protein [Anaerolineae bacterium]|jgi:putative sterol carrier protein
MKLASLDYLEEVRQRSNADAEYLELARGHNASYTLVLEPEPDKGVAEQIVVGFDNVDGELDEMWVGQRPTDFTLSAPYGVWVDILRGKMGPTKAIASRKLRTQGPFVKLLQGANRIIRWVEILRTIPTEFEGDYAEHNLPDGSE